MIRYIIRRLLWAVVLFIAVTLVTFVIFYLIPVDPARLAAGKAATPAEVQAGGAPAVPGQADLEAVRATSSISW